MMLIVCSAQSSFAQYEKGSKEFISLLRFRYSEYSSAGNFSTRFNILSTNRYGWFVKDKVVVGVVAGYGFEDYKCEGRKEIDEFTHRLKLGIYSRRYFKGIGKFSPFIEGNLTYNHSREKRVNSSNDPIEIDKDKTSVVDINGLFGVQFRANDWFSIEGTLTPFLTSTIYEGPNEYDSRSMSVGFNPSFSMQFSSISVGARFKI